MTDTSSSNPPSEGSRPIRTWALDDRPRERMRALGPTALSPRELLAILIGSGGATGSALDVGERILSRVQGSLRRLASLPTAALEAESGVGAATASRIQAALELGRRAAAEPSHANDRIRGPRDVFERMGPLMRDLRQEEFHALLLNTQHRVIRDVLVTRGILDASLIHPREVFRVAIVECASGVILVHNHPSGDPTPSQEDRAVTHQLAAAGKAIGIPVLD
ncbi:MAG: DNA repair protein RadC, partial [Gemmatimonadota bacterium]